VAPVSITMLSALPKLVLSRNSVEEHTTSPQQSTTPLLVDAFEVKLHWLSSRVDEPFPDLTSITPPFPASQPTIGWWFVKVQPLHVTFEACAEIPADI
jgi:hypothetical protein